MSYKIPQPVVQTLEKLKVAGFQAFLVGGSLRDLLLGRVPRDWDITTDARPEEIQGLFSDSIYENTFGTVGIKVPRFLRETPETQGTDIIEVTTFRTEGKYHDQRHPENVVFVSSVEEDLARRDFTVNALAAEVTTDQHQKAEEKESALAMPLIACHLSLIDPFQGQVDLSYHRIRAVGNPEERFREDALRLMRAIRLVTELGSPWSIEETTKRSLERERAALKNIAPERVRDEFSRILLSPRPAFGVDLLQKTGLLPFIVPELIEGVGVTQNLHHIYTVWEHNLRALETCPSPKLSVRLAALLHDVAKPRTKRGEGYHSTFYNHDHVGAKMARQILERLRFPKKIIDHAVLLIDNHLFYYNVGEVTEASVRRLIKRVGRENIDDLMAVRIGDRLGSGVPKAKPYKLRHLEYMVDKVSNDPTSVKMLAINGTTLMAKIGLRPGPKVGAILDCLLAEVIEDPKRNQSEWLLDRGRQLMDNDLALLQSLAKEKIREEQKRKDDAIKNRHHVS